MSILWDSECYSCYPCKIDNTPGKANFDEQILPRTNFGQHIVNNHAIHSLNKVDPSPTLLLGMSKEEEKDTSREFYFEVQVNCYV